MDGVNGSSILEVRRAEPILSFTEVNEAEQSICPLVCKKTEYSDLLKWLNVTIQLYQDFRASTASDLFSQNFCDEMMEI